MWRSKRHEKVESALLPLLLVPGMFNPAIAALDVSVDMAQARVGHPFTPMSVAGVNSRVHRHAYHGAAAAGAAGYGYYNY